MHTQPNHQWYAGAMESAIEGAAYKFPPTASVVFYINPVLLYLHCCYLYVYIAGRLCGLGTLYTIIKWSHMHVMSC